MNWTEIILAIVTFLGGGGIAAFFTMRSRIKKGDAEASSASIKAMDEMMSLVKRMEEEKRELQLRIDSIRGDFRNEIDTLVKENNELNCQLLTMSYCMCLHFACPLRRPTLGRGQRHCIEHCNEENFGADYTPIDELFGNYKRKKFDFAYKDEPKPHGKFGKENQGSVQVKEEMGNDNQA